MHVIRSTDSLPPLDPEIHDLIERRVEELGPDADLATFVVVEPGDSLDAVEMQLGFSLLSNRVDGTRFGDPAFTPTVDILEEHATCFELVFVLQDDGSGAVLLVPKQDGIDRELLSFCAAYAVPSTQHP